MPSKLGFSCLGAGSGGSPSPFGHVVRDFPLVHLKHVSKSTVSRVSMSRETAVAHVTISILCPMLLPQRTRMVKACSELGPLLLKSN